MSYVPSHKTPTNVAQPIALTIIEHTLTTSQSIAIGNKVQVGTIHNWFGSFSPTISNNQITLPSGFLYYIETTVQCNRVGGFSYVDHIATFQMYDETNSSNIGTPFTVTQAEFEQDDELYSRDSCGRAFLDCTSSSINFSIKVQATENWTHINYNGNQNYNTGQGRTIIWQLA